MNKFWQKLDQQQRYLFGLSLALLILLSVYGWMILPLQERVTQLAALKHDHETLLLWMQQADQQLAQAVSSPGRTLIKLDNQQLLTVLQQSLRTTALASVAVEIKQQTAHSVSVQFNAVNFDLFSSWLVNVWRQYHINIEQVEIRKMVDQGTVAAMVILTV